MRFAPPSGTAPTRSDALAHASAVGLGLALTLVALGGLVTSAHAAAPRPAGSHEHGSPLARPPEQPSGSALRHRLERFGVVGSVLYVAAHPDDENTRLIAYLSRGMGLRVGYYSMTRGDGGQNLIGAERSELLGVIRTQELMAARRIDGGEQMFSRAKDFGYSKTPEETLRIWGDEQALADTVWAIRVFRPDVIVTRFAASGRNHGHHTASAQLAARAFRLAADPSAFPEQLEVAGVEPWQADRLVRNVSHWRLKKDADTSMYGKLDVGGYAPELGLSYGEIAARSRSQHKSQGFGVTPNRGNVTELFEGLDGTAIAGEASPFEGLRWDFERFEGGDDVSDALEDALKAFEPAAPWKALEALGEAKDALAGVGDATWRAHKTAQLDQLIADVAGLWLEAVAQAPNAAPGEAVEVKATALNRTRASVMLVATTWSDGTRDLEAEELAPGVTFEAARELTVPKDAAYTSPFWLADWSDDPAAYAIGEQARRHDPVAAAPMRVRYELMVGAPGADDDEHVAITLERDVVWKWTDRVTGEQAGRFEIVPAFTVTPTRGVALVQVDAAEVAKAKKAFDTRQRKLPKLQRRGWIPASVEVEVTVRAGGAGGEAQVAAVAPTGWRVVPERQRVSLEERGSVQRVTFRVSPVDDAAPTAPGDLRFYVEAGGERYGHARRVVDYPHIGGWTVLEPARIRVVPLALKTGGKRVGYIPGPGDEVAESLAGVGYDVTVLDDEALAAEDFGRFDAIVVGVRAFNVNPELWVRQLALHEYVAGGGTLVVQYQTHSRWSPLGGNLGPAPLELSRGRVTDETAAVTAIDPNHPAVTTPNVLGAGDWKGWVQERGLYFAGTWAEDAYEPIFAMHDAGEEPLTGSTLVMRHGDGAFVYTGISFFRQLPAGVAGAYRLLANLLALGGSK